MKRYIKLFLIGIMFLSCLGSVVLMSQLIQNMKEPAPSQLDNETIPRHQTLPSQAPNLPAVHPSANQSPTQAVNKP